LYVKKLVKKKGNSLFTAKPTLLTLPMVCREKPIRDPKHQDTGNLTGIYISDLFDGHSARTPH